MELNFELEEQPANWRNKLMFDLSAMGNRLGHVDTEPTSGEGVRVTAAYEGEPLTEAQVEELLEAIDAKPVAATPEEPERRPRLR